MMMMTPSNTADCVSSFFVVVQHRPRRATRDPLRCGIALMRGWIDGWS
jgi:hypothetical protein